MYPGSINILCEFFDSSEILKKVGHKLTITMDRSAKEPPPGVKVVSGGEYINPRTAHVTGIRSGPGLLLAKNEDITNGHHSPSNLRLFISLHIQQRLG